MSYLHQTAPIASSARVMRSVSLACLPGIAAQTWYFGAGVITNVLTGILCCCLVEALMLAARSRPLRPTLADGSAMLTGILLGAALPAGISVWLILIGAVAAIAVAKHLYGGLGHNIFNPAMVGYAMLLVSFPVPLSLWPDATGFGAGDVQNLSHLWQGWLGQLDANTLDAVSGATPLDALRQPAGASVIGDANLSSPWAIISLAWLSGGLVLLAQRLIDWRLPLAMLSTMAVLAALLNQVSGTGSVAFHLFNGATIMGAFFIITDPVSAPGHRRARWVFGAAIGALVMLIRGYGGYPDAIAFAVLLMNLSAPLLDQLCSGTHRSASDAPRGNS
ncbi:MULTISPECIES: RnfABCDGE type electron transport complex subunit D [unclassified Halomonas]|uniref:RnfABCDGE type electron transport complex subunit D n=1 Tax=unclassified Halomonas TaxID=2609666 RepID=UPI001C9606EE|nr:MULTISPECIES: RnfABCDGE type electron transport complex subunit D [unclassified Halomonas]MBY5925992.1 RnfABCDGE type electron transport complex subunit D [Halomonas sp. DP4Y7-2]MBY6233034.1 RnfABCDGE type electron transport complex subunit D [Halomonas sp. DP4Y7-1]